MLSPYGSSTALSAMAPATQTLILIASDGVRVPISRAIATEASFVLRDLLDGQDLQREGGGTGGFAWEESTSPHLSTTDAAVDLENLFEVPSNPTPTSNGAEAWQPPRQSPTQQQHTHAGSKAAGAAKPAVPDLMDFFPVAPAPKPAVAPAAAVVPAMDIFAEMLGESDASAVASPAAASARSAVSVRLPPLAQSAPSPSHAAGGAPLQPPPPLEVEVPFPYFTGDILERVCRHMSYRFRMSSFGTEDGCYRVYVVKTRAIPRPMTLPLVEYLDLKDRSFIADWDELMTVQMVKAATLLNYEELLQLASAKLASYLIDRDLEGVRTLLGVESDFDPLEEAELKKEQATDSMRW